MTVPTSQEALRPLYRPARPVPFELAQHASIFLEEKLYTQGLNFLLNILTSGTVASTPALVPPVQHLAVAATFLVHPATTTRAKTAEEEEAPHAALRLLRLTNTLVGPIASKLGPAFSFSHLEISRHGGRRRADDTPVRGDLSADDARPLNLDLGQSQSLWSRAGDFWHAVGWAFNCSVLHHERWARWQVWLEFMCDVLESDWNERTRHRHRDKTKEQDPSLQILKDSLIFQYIDEASAVYGRNRRIVRSIFADGGSTSSNEFREVFSHELKHAAKTDSANGKKRSAQRPQSPRPRPRHQHARRPYGGSAPSTGIIVPINEIPTKHIPYMHGDVGFFGGMRSLALRQRLLHLLSTVSEFLPEDFTPLEDLYHLFAENIRHLPLPIFQAFISPTVLPSFSPAAQTTLCEFLLYRMRETAAPTSDEEYLNQGKLVQCFLPYSANTSSTSDNAKISIILESLLILLADSSMLTSDPALDRAVRDGIDARARKSQRESRRDDGSQFADHIEYTWLAESAERLLFLVDEFLPHVEGTAMVE
ncbi:hypothetical protein BO70DRAFT_427308 [Aspergillus heteromorphus CBS 117.55]|uniref:Uncharacterized protein n=1 Tax=Aspergillus heteromorphus CBS 117.55 TaxID=1448321 RepID=A0A317WQ43_9EURO|nr:uncharacterized protein BO70DRAFT_427308 [Aspergillus heteromorphus CBS 117.55]PWY88543.1 hypothetical protein BO70DRAFT_427308 [Aspergillus heteromorphus CBS 117.55]